MENLKALASSNSNESVPLRYCHWYLNDSVIIMSLLLLQSELGEGISLMPAAIKHEISVFILPLVSLFVQVLPKLSLANGKLFFGFISHLDPQKVSFIARPSFRSHLFLESLEQSSLYFVGRHVIVRRQQQQAF